MPLVTTKEMFEKSIKEGFAIGAFNVNNMEISFLEPLACCVRAVERANATKGTSSLVIGLGSIGLLMGQAIKSFKGDVIGPDMQIDFIIDIVADDFLYFIQSPSRDNHRTIRRIL